MAEKNAQYPGAPGEPEEREAEKHGLPPEAPVPEEPTARIYLGEIDPDWLDLADDAELAVWAGAADEAEARAAEEPPAEAAAAAEAAAEETVPGWEPTTRIYQETAAEETVPQEEPTRHISDFDLRFWALTGNRGDIAVPEEPSQGEEPSQTAEQEPQEDAGKKKKRPIWLEEEEEREERRDYLPIRFRRDSRLGCLGGLMYATFVICVSIVLACVAWMAASDVLALNKEPLTVEVTLPDELFSDVEVEEEDEEGNVTGTKTVRSADIEAVSRLLKDYGIINYKWLFRWYSAFSHADRQIDPGTYELSTSYDYRALVKKMQVGSDSQIQTSVTFPEGFNMRQIFERLEENGICSQEALYEAAAGAEYSYAFLKDLELGNADRLEGFLFPDTYFFFQGMQASSALNKFLSNFHTKTTQDMWQAAYDRGFTMRQLVTVASIVEKEAADDNERFLIAAVIYNRLQQEMPLQMDSTVLYGCGDPAATEVTGTMMRDEENLYNTYIHPGLTPGPICNPGMASIRAAVSPANVGYLYFALDEETGTHEFFDTLQDFEAFVATQSYGQG